MKTLINKWSFIPFPGILILVIFLIPAAQAQDPAGSTLHAGVAKVNITPETPIPMSGYGSRKEVFQGIHDSLYVTATVFKNESNKSVLITADLIGFSDPFYKETSQKVEKATGINKDFIFLSANHIHGGPENMTYSNDVS